MTRLLVSVRDAAEAEVALEAGVDLIDVKEPSLGSLGAASPRVLAEVARVVDGRASLSAALGELLATEDAQRSFASGLVSTDIISADPVSLPNNLQFVKWGLAGCAAHADWPQRWQYALAKLPGAVGRVAVIYADAQRAQSPAADEILEWAPRLACRAVLLDTFDKQAGTLLDHWQVEKVRQLLATGRRLGMLTVIAGSLNEASLERILSLEPDYVGVRGAACDRTRTGRLCPARLARLVNLVRAPFHAESHREKTLRA